MELSIVGPLSILISIIAAAFAFPNRTHDRYLLAYLLLGLHIAATITNYVYIQTHDADAPLYYYDVLSWSYVKMAFGTIFLVKFVHFLRDTIGGSYFEYFLLFQSFGFIGIVLLTRLISTLQYEGNVPSSHSPLLVFFLPSMYFWTVAIGKDAPLFLGTSLAAWSAMKLVARWPFFLLSLAIMVPIRPHIAFIAAIALMLSLVLDNRQHVVLRMLFLSTAAIGSFYLISTVSSTLSVDATDPNAVIEFFHRQQDLSKYAPGTTSVRGNFIVRLLSLLFRPFFFDAHGFFGIISSFENLVFVVGMIALMRNFTFMRRYIASSFFAKYCFFFTAILTVLLAQVYYNVGLGLRQRVMVYPTLLPLLIVALAVTAEAKRRRRAEEANRNAGFVLAAAHGAGTVPSPEIEGSEIAGPDARR